MPASIGVACACFRNELFDAPRVNLGCGALRLVSVLLSKMLRYTAHSMRMPLSPNLRLIAAWVLLFPFFGVSLVANGIMPMKASNGAIMLVICTGEGMVEMAFDPVTMAPAPEADDGTGGPSETSSCDWAASHPVFDLTTGTMLQSKDLYLKTTAPRLSATVLRVAEATGLPPSTGPPVTF